MQSRKLTRIAALLALPAACTLAAITPAAAAGGGARPAVARLMPGHALGGPVAPQPAIKPSAVAGYTWSDGEAFYDYNSSGHAVTITPHDPATGEYSVSFDGLQSIGYNGDVQVSSYDTEDTCVILGWGAVSTAEVVQVACYTPAGVLVTTGALFDLTITVPHSKPSGVFDYAWVNPDTKSLKLKGLGEYNSSHKVNQVKHLGTGRYEVLFPGPKSKGVHGTVQVTTFGAGAGNCVQTGWAGTKSGVEVGVHCFTASGTSQNREFDVVYASANNILGLNRVTDANILANGKGGINPPAEEYLSAKHAKAIVIQYYTGSYEVALAGSEGNAKYGGDVQVSAVNSRDYRCYVNSWGQESTPAVYVECFSLGKSVHSVSTPFTVQWVVP